MKRLLPIFLVTVFISSCYPKLKPISPPTIPQLPEGKGFLLFAIDSDEVLYELKIGGKRSRSLSQEQLQKRSYYLVILPSGKYRFEEFSIIPPKDQSTKNTSETLTMLLGLVDSDDNDAKWEFEVEPGKICYAGDLRISGLEYVIRFDSHRLATLLINRSSYAYAYMKKHFPSVLDSHAMLFTGVGSDRFFERIEALKQGSGRIK
ncbi:MAG: hypothetical protein QNJ97_10635 [Myxococcota bacterium]|nr:hypothetical protein [Myxococcota bacterium]